MTTEADLEGKDDQVVRVVGEYAVQDMGRYQLASELEDGTTLVSSYCSYLSLDGGGWVILGARPESEHALAGQIVAATGVFKAAWPPRQDPKVAQPDARPTLLKITSVEPLR